MKEFFKKKIGKVTTLMMACFAMVTAAALPVGAAPVDFGTSTGLTVTVPDVVSTGFSFMGMFDSYTMLVLGVMFAPVALGFIIWLWRKLPKGGGSKG